MQKVEYLKNDHAAYIDLGYKPKRNTRIEAEFTATTGPDWKALYGTRFQANAQNGVDFPGTSNFSSGNGWKPGFAFFTTNDIINLGDEHGGKDHMIFDQKIKTIQDAVAGNLKIYQDGNLVNTIEDSPLGNDCETSLYIFAINKHLPVIAGYNDNPDAFGDNNDPCINTWVKLYSMKIYEGNVLKYDLVLVLSEGKGGLLDQISNQVYYSANNADFVVPEECGITAYEGKVNYTGHEPADGEFYLYNVGRKAYLTNGSDWGAHAALGYPGLEATLASNDAGFTIQFNELIPGDARDKYLGGSPYVDCSDGDKTTYAFEAVSDKPGVYNIKGERGYLAFDSEGEVDGGGIKHINTVTALWPTPKNEDAEWILVSKADRLAQLDNATQENPVDASFVIKNASFNKYANLGEAWTGISQGWEWGNRNFGDKNTEHFHSDNEGGSFSLNQEVSLPKEGWYELTVQAFFRDGNIDPHVESVLGEETLAEAPVLWVGQEETPLMYIHAEADKAPGEGTDTQIGNIPNNMIEASKFFENGLYKNSLLFHVDATDLENAIGIDELDGYRAESWIVIDNFRLKYYGNGEKPVDTGVEMVKNAGEPTTSRIIFNLAGQRLARPQKGINIINGRKVVMK